MDIQQLFLELGIKKPISSYTTGTTWKEGNGDRISSFSPIDGKEITDLTLCTVNQYDEAIQKAAQAFPEWRKIPAPKRGEIVRQYGDALRQNKEALGRLVTLEMGKSLQEGLGEVQEMIDICDFAVGLSRQLYGLTMHSERPEHRMYEQWHPLGIVGIISAFNFPVAVWAWNAMIAAVCGDVCIWKPSEKTPVSAIACHKILEDVLKKNNIPEGVFCLVVGDAEIGKAMASDEKVALVSATGSTRMGKAVAENVAKRLGKTILELGGNNAIIMTEKANLGLALNAVVFGAVGTCGQRCTSTRRLIVHEKIYNEVKERIVDAYSRLTIGDPLNQENLVGPLIDEAAVDQYFSAIEKAKTQGGKVLVGAEKVNLPGFYVKPTIIEAANEYEIVQDETFAPILYLIKYSGDVQNAIKLQNDVKQGLSSAIFSDDISETETFLSAWGSDCGIANVNIGTSGAEIGGAFGGEKDTGGGRESGSDAWKAYMRRQTNTLNFGKNVPLAQGIEFNI